MYISGLSANTDGKCIARKRWFNMYDHIFYFGSFPSRYNKIIVLKQMTLWSILRAVMDK